VYASAAVYPRLETHAADRYTVAECGDCAGSGIRGADGAYCDCPTGYVRAVCADLEGGDLLETVILRGATIRGTRVA
jgi:hypothetical protein